MSIKVSAYVWKHAKHRGTAKLLILALADFANDSGVCWPSAATLAERIGETERHTRRLLSDLEESGDIISVPGGGRGKTTRYGIAVGLTPKQRDKLNSVLQNTVSGNTDIQETVTSGDENSDIWVQETVTSGHTIDAPFSAPERVEVPQNTGGIRHGSVIDPSGDERDDAKASRTPRKKEPKAEKPPTPKPIRDALAEVCQIGKLSTREQVLQLNQSAAAIWKAQADDGREPEQVAADIRYVAGYFKRQDWRGKRGDLPRPADVREVWQPAMAARTAEKPAATKYYQSQAHKYPPEEERRRLLVEGLAKRAAIRNVGDS